MGRIPKVEKERALEVLQNANNPEGTSTQPIQNLEQSTEEPFSPTPSHAHSVNELPSNPSGSNLSYNHQYSMFKPEDEQSMLCQQGLSDSPNDALQEMAVVPSAHASSTIPSSSNSGGIHHENLSQSFEDPHQQNSLQLKDDAGQHRAYPHGAAYSEGRYQYHQMAHSANSSASSTCSTAHPSPHLAVSEQSNSASQAVSQSSDSYMLSSQVSNNVNDFHIKECNVKSGKAGGGKLPVRGEGGWHGEQSHPYVKPSATRTGGFDSGTSDGSSSGKFRENGVVFSVWAVLSKISKEV